MELIPMITQSLGMVLCLVLLNGCTQAPVHFSPPVHPMHEPSAAMKLSTNEQAILHAIEEATRPQETDMQTLGKIFNFDPRAGFGKMRANFIPHNDRYQKITFDGPSYIQGLDDLRKWDSVTIDLSGKMCIDSYHLPSSFIRQNNLGASFEEFYYSYYIINSKYIAVMSNTNTRCVAAISIYINLKDSPWEQYNPLGN